MIRKGVVALEFCGSTKLETYEERSPCKVALMQGPSLLLVRCRWR